MLNISYTKKYKYHHICILWQPYCKKRVMINKMAWNARIYEFMLITAWHIVSFLTCLKLSSNHKVHLQVNVCYSANIRQKCFHNSHRHT
jgi:hypothetical protein